MKSDVCYPDYLQYYPVNNNNVAHINPSYTICPYYHHVKAIQVVLMLCQLLWLGLHVYDIDKPRYLIIAKEDYVTQGPAPNSGNLL
jgi:hypothetical protein